MQGNHGCHSLKYVQAKSMPPGTAAAAAATCKQPAPHTLEVQPTVKSCRPAQALTASCGGRCPRASLPGGGRPPAAAPLAPPMLKNRCMEMKTMATWSCSVGWAGGIR